MREIPESVVSSLFCFSLGGGVFVAGLYSQSLQSGSCAGLGTHLGLRVSLFLAGTLVPWLFLFAIYWGGGKGVGGLYYQAWEGLHYQALYKPLDKQSEEIGNLLLSIFLLMVTK